MAFHEERERAESFGQAARSYDEFRPQYPDSVIERIVSASGLEVPRVLDVGSGTGILTAQLRATGCEVLAVEPDREMAAVAREKGIDVEVSSFEDWDPGERTFDIVAFGQSFHWVDPTRALPRIAHMLEPAGTLALVWNDIQATGALGQALTEVSERFTPIAKSQTEGAEESHPVLRDLEGNGFAAEELSFEESLDYSREEWLSMIFTHSAQLTMEPESRDRMYAEMFEAIPSHGLKAHNRAQLILAQPSG